MVTGQHLEQPEVFIKFSVRIVDMFVSSFLFSVGLRFRYLSSGTLSNAIHMQVKSRKRVEIQWF